MAHIQKHRTVLAVAVSNFRRHRAAHHVAARQLQLVGRVLVHKTGAVLVDEISPFTAHTFANQNAAAAQTRRVELHHLQIRRRGARAHGMGHAVAGVGHGVSVVGEQAAIPAGGDADGFGIDLMKLAGLDVHHDGTRSAAIIGSELEQEKFVIHLGAQLDGLLPQRVQHGVAGAVGGVGGAGEVLAAERALRNRAVFLARERTTHAVQVQHRFWRFLAHQVNAVLIADEVRALHRVIRVVVPVVLGVDGRVHATLRRATVAAQRVNLAHHGSIQTRRDSFKGRTHPGQPGPDNQNVVLFDRHEKTLFLGQTLKPPAPPVSFIAQSLPAGADRRRRAQPLGTSLPTAGAGAMYTQFFLLETSPCNVSISILCRSLN